MSLGYLCFLWFFSKNLQKTRSLFSPYIMGEYTYIYSNNGFLVFFSTFLNSFLSGSFFGFLFLFHVKNTRNPFFHNFTKEFVNILRSKSDWVLCKKREKNTFETQLTGGNS